jgi:hypothetical protein
MKKPTRNFYFILTILSVTFGVLISSCAKKSDDEGSSTTVTITNVLSEAMSMAAVSSPTAQEESSTSIFSLNPIILSAATTDQVESLSTQLTNITAQLTQSTEAGCFAGVSFQITQAETRISCYGPEIAISLSYQGPTYGTFMVTNNISSTQYGSAPVGDLGIWSATQGGTEACLAAKMNTVAKDASKIVDSSQKLFAALLCAANLTGEELPAVNQSSGNLSALINSNVPGANITSATISRGADSSDNFPTYTISIIGTITAGSINSASISLTSSNTKTTTGAKGRIHGFASGLSGGKYAGFSLVYEDDGTNLKTLYKASQNRNTTGYNFFDTSNNLDFTKSDSGENFYYALSDVNKSNNVGSMYFAWQAGDGDSHSRVFRVKSTEGTPDTGFGYYGYGPKINDSANQSSLGSITGMICNWAVTQNSDHTSQITAMSGKAQSQSFQRNSSGVFVPVTNNINYAPTSSCNVSTGSFSAWTVSMGTGNPPPRTLDAGSEKSFASVYTNDLVTSVTNGTVSTITAPTY